MGCTCHCRIACTGWRPVCSAGEHNNNNINTFSSVVICMCVCMLNLQISNFFLFGCKVPDKAKVALTVPTEYDTHLILSCPLRVLIRSRQERGPDLADAPRVRWWRWCWWWLMCACVCVCMCADMHLLVFTCVCLCVFAFVRTCTCLCIHCVHVCVFAHVQTCTCLCIHCVCWACPQPSAWCSSSLV